MGWNNEIPLNFNISFEIGPFLSKKSVPFLDECCLTVGLGPTEKMWYDRGINLLLGTPGGWCYPGH